MKKLIVAATLLVCATAFAKETKVEVRPDAVPVIRTIAGSPLRLIVGDDTSFQLINSQFPGNGQIFPANCTTGTGDAGVFAAVGGTLYSPNFREHSCGSAAASAQGTSWTPVSISNVNGTGSNSDPFRVVVVADAGATGVQLTATYTYVNGESFFRLIQTYCASTTTSLNAYLGADIFLANSDSGIPSLEPASGSPGGRDCNNAGFSILLVPTTRADRFTAREFNAVWNEIGSRGDLSNSVAQGCQDNGAAVQWKRTITGGACATITSAASFGPIPTIALFRIDTLSPAMGNQGQSLTVNVSGVGFQSGTTFSFGSGVTVTSTRIINDSSATVNITIAPGAAEGSRSVTGTQTAGGSTSSIVNGFRVLSSINLRPDVVTISPSCGSPAGGTDLTLTGSGFQPGATVTFNGAAARSVTFVSPTSIRAVTPQMAVGPVTVVVTNPGGLSTTSTLAFRAGSAPQVAPQLTGPSGTVFARTPFNISWVDAEPVSNFLIEVSTSQGFTSILQSFLVDGSLRSSTLLLEQTGSFFIRVSGDNGCGRRAGNIVPVTVVPSPANVVVTAQPAGMFQFGMGPANSDSFTVTNTGGAPTTITLEQQGNFFTIPPNSFTLMQNQSQVVNVTPAGVQPAGVQEGSVLIRGNGAPQDLAVSIRLSVPPPIVGTARPAPSTNRVDVAAPAGMLPGGSVDYTNNGTGTLTGYLVADVPWIITSRNPVSIPPGGTVSVPFTIDRSKRPDSASPAGSVAGKISLVYSPGSPTGKLDDSSVPLESGMSAFAPVGITDTVKPVVTNAAVPPAGNIISYFMPGVGRITSSSGTFISDVALTNTKGAGAVNDIRLFFLPRGGLSNNAQTTSFNQLLPNQSFHLADVVKSVFNNDSQLGSLQVRALDSARLALNASIFNVSNPKGTFGSVIPIFRSDRTIGPDGRLYMTGLRRDAGGHTNFYVQETAGATATVNIEFLDAAGASLGRREEVLQSFGFLQISSPVPEGGVSAVITNNTASAGRVQAYATPVDRESGDFWAVADWARQYNFTATEPALIPIAGRLRGANNSNFRTDVSIFNIGTSAGSGTLRYYPRGGAPIDRPIALEANQTRVLNDVVSVTFGLTTDSVGYLLFTPTEGSFAVTSRTYTTILGSPGTFGTGVPAIGLAASMRQGEVQKFAGIEDVTLATVMAAKPGTFRTNFGIIETAGETVTVRATLRYTEARGAFAAVGVGTRDFVLGPREFALVSNISRAILGETRDTNFGDLRNLQVDFEVMSPGGRAMVFTSSTDNGTNDTILRLGEK